MHWDDSKYSINSDHLLCANESCPYQVKYEECVLKNRGEGSAESEQLCSNQLCSYHNLFKECFTEPVEKPCLFERCPFKKRYGKCGIHITKAIEHEVKCTNPNCRLKMLCQQCNVKKKKISLPDLCSNSLCPFKMYYEECFDIADRVVNVDEGALGLCTNEFCPYKTVYKQCEISAPTISDFCSIKGCPYKSVFLEKELVKEKDYDTEPTICDNEVCPYRLLYEEIAIHLIEKASSEDKSPHVPCNINSIMPVCSNEICIYKKDRPQHEDIVEDINISQLILEEETILYKYDSKIEIYSPKLSRIINSSESFDIQLEKMLKYKCYPGEASIESENVSISKLKKYKFDSCAQFSETHFIIDELIQEIITAVIAEKLPKAHFDSSTCVNETCYIQQKQKRKMCDPFKEVVIFAENFIDDIILDAKVEAAFQLNLKMVESESVGHHFLPNEFPSKPIPKYEPFSVIKNPPFCWPSIREFTVSLGAKKITEFVTSLDVDECWLCGIYYMKCIREKISFLHCYEVIFALPTPIYPIPQATVSVYFTIEVSKVIPSSCPVQVTYQVETNRCVLNAETSIINERWLLRVLKAKISVNSAINF